MGEFCPNLSSSQRTCHQAAHVLEDILTHLALAISDPKDGKAMKNPWENLTPPDLLGNFQSTWHHLGPIAPCSLAELPWNNSISAQQHKQGLDSNAAFQTRDAKAPGPVGSDPDRVNVATLHHRLDLDWMTTCWPSSSGKQAISCSWYQ